MKRAPLFLFALLLTLSAEAASAEGIEDLTIDGNEVSARVALAGGIGADLTLTFDTVSGLSASSLGLSAELVDPTSLALVSRLPTGASGIPTGFPVLIRIAPPALGGLEFHRTVTLDLHTTNLDYFPGTPLRLFAAPAGGNFADITTAVGSGSYRPRGVRGDFSDFLIVADMRSLADTIEAKFDALEAALDRHSGSIPSSWVTELSGYIADARTAYEDSDPTAAASAIEEFVTRVGEGAGSALPDLWRAARDVANVAGELAADAGTLRFSLLVQAGAAG